MFCIVLPLTSWCTPPPMALVSVPGSHGMEMKVYICQEQSTVCPNFFFPLYCLYIYRGLMCLSWLEGGTAVRIETRVIKMLRPIAVSIDRSTFAF